MRLVTIALAVLAFSTLAGCATQTSATRGGDTAVRAEARRISNTRPYAARRLVAEPMSSSERAQRATGL